MKPISIIVCLIIFVSFQTITIAEENDKEEKPSFFLDQKENSEERTGDASTPHYDVLLSGEVLDWYEKALRRYNQGVYDDAIIYVNRVLKEYPDYIPALRLRGQSYIAKGEKSKSKLDSDNQGYDKHIFEFQQAEKAFSRIIELDPKNEKAYFYRGLSYRYLDYYPVLAIEDLNKYIDDFGHKTSESLLERGIAYRQRGYMKESIEDLEEAIRLGSDDVENYLHLMKSYEVNPNYDLAESFFETMTRLQPDKAHSWYYRGLTNFKLGRHIDARLYLRRALSLYPDYEEAKELLDRIK